MVEKYQSTSERRATIVSKIDLASKKTGQLPISELAASGNISDLKKADRFSRAQEALTTYVKKSIGELSFMQQELDNGIYSLPDGTKIGIKDKNTLNFLALLPTIPETAILSSDAASSVLKVDLERKIYGLPEAKSRISGLVSRINNKIFSDTIDWEVRNAAPEFIEVDGKKRRAEAAYYLTPKEKTDDLEIANIVTQETTPVLDTPVENPKDIVMLTEDATQLKEPEIKVPSLGDNLKDALEKLDVYLQTPREQMLREHQVDVMQSIRDFLAEGHKAGYISLPTGSGKTVLITELIQTLGLKTIVASPTQQILEQTFKTAQRFNPDFQVSNYYSRSKDLTGDAINTTYHSLLRLVDEGKIDPEEIQLVICDEAHTALGEQRHGVFRKFPNALMIGLTATPYFAPLEGYKQRGIVDAKENWTGLFTNTIHEMSLEEAIERGILSNLDAHLLKTNTMVGDVHITANGEYNEAEIQSYLNKEARNYLTIGMLAGIDKIPESIRLSNQQIEELKVLHEKIKDKRTVIFGLSISHIEDLAKKLQELGVKAATVHSKVDPARRSEVLEGHAKGDIPVILGVDMLRLGWDSPATEVGIYLAPTQSGVVAVQELGRILRPSEETDKKKAVAIQLVDQYKDKSQSPILIPNIFDPYYILRGTQTGEKPSNKTGKTNTVRPAITFTGMDVETIVEEARSQEMLQGRFKKASIDEMGVIIDAIVSDIQQEYIDLPAIELYRKIADALPSKTSSEAQQIALQAIASIDTNTVQTGKRVFTLLNFKSVLSAIEPYLSEKETENDEIVHIGLSSFFENLNKINPRSQISAQVYGLTQRGLISYIASRENMATTWVRDHKHNVIKERVLAEFMKFPFGLDKTKIEALADEISEQTGYDAALLTNYITIKNSEIIPDDTYDDDEIIESATHNILSQEISDVLDLLARKYGSKRYRKIRTIIEKRYGLRNAEILTLKAIGKEIGLSSTRVGQIESKVLRELRHPSRSKRLYNIYRSESSYVLPPKVGEYTFLDPLFAIKDLNIGEQTISKLTNAGVKNISQLPQFPKDELEKMGNLKQEDLVSLERAITGLLAKSSADVTFPSLYSWLLSIRKSMQE